MRKSVMFVDDSLVVLASTKSATLGMDIDVVQFDSAVKAMEEINNNNLRVDLIITDLNMPDMNGFEFLDALRHHSEMSKVPTLMLTTESRDEMKQKGKALGLTGWIVKPFNEKQLQNAIKRVLRIG